MSEQLKPTAAGPIPQSVLKRKTVFVAYGFYSRCGWDVRVAQLAPAYFRYRYFGSHANLEPGKPGHRTLRQVRAICLQQTRAVAYACGAHDAGIRSERWYPSTQRLADELQLSSDRLSLVLNEAVAALGSYRDALAWLRRPCLELKNRIPLRMARTDLGQVLLTPVLLRIRFRHLRSARPPARNDGTS